MSQAESLEDRPLNKYQAEGEKFLADMLGADTAEEEESRKPERDNMETDNRLVWLLLKRRCDCFFEGARLTTSAAPWSALPFFKL